MLINFDYVEPHHEAIDASLRNWARWVKGGHGNRDVHPMFRQYRPDNWERDVSPHDPIDALKAADMQKAVGRLPEKHRHAIGWVYVIGGSPRRQAQKLAVSLDGLYMLIRDGRQMLINRGA